MAKSVFFEVKVRRFGVWQASVGAVAAADLAAVAAWAAATLEPPPAPDRALVFGCLAVLALATAAVALSLARVEPGVLSCRNGVWCYVTEAGAGRQGALVVAIDLGTFLMLRLRDGSRTSIWLPMQRRGLEREWHALRCAVYSPPVVEPASTPPPTQRG